MRLKVGIAAVKELESKTHVSVCRVCWHGAHIVRPNSINNVTENVERFFDKKKRMRLTRFLSRERVVPFHVNFHKEKKMNPSSRGTEESDRTNHTNSNTGSSTFTFYQIHIENASVDSLAQNASSQIVI